MVCFLSYQSFLSWNSSKIDCQQLLTGKGLLTNLGGIRVHSRDADSSLPSWQRPFCDSSSDISVRNEAETSDQRKIHLHTLHVGRNKFTARKRRR